MVEAVTRDDGPLAFGFDHDTDVTRCVADGRDQRNLVAQAVVHLDQFVEIPVHDRLHRVGKDRPVGLVAAIGRPVLVLGPSH